MKCPICKTEMHDITPNQLHWCPHCGIEIAYETIKVIRKQVCDEIKHRLREKVEDMYPDIDGIVYPRKAVKWHDLVPILNQIKRGIK